MGPSLLGGVFTATAADGTHGTFYDFGGAVDAGYQVLIADHVVLSLGAGAQYLFSTSGLPTQQIPARVFANSGFAPRVLLSLGWAF